MNRIKQKKVTITIAEYENIVKAEQEVDLNAPDFITTMAMLIHDSAAYRVIKPHIERMKCKGMK